MADQQDQQPQWSEQYQRWILMKWDHNYRRWYWMHESDGQWTFLDWVPVAQATQEPTHMRNDSAATVSAHVPRYAREGLPIYGTYSTENPSPTEQLDASFFVRRKEYFKPGTVFSILFTEAAGSTATNYNDSFTMVKFGEYAHTQVRRFVVVRQKKAHCFAIPIFTYGNQGTLKSGIDPMEHAIAYSYGQTPQILNGEHPGLVNGSLGKPPICIVLHESNYPLTSASRLYYGIHHPIQYNVKVKDLGYVHPESLRTLLECWAKQIQDLTDNE